MESLQIPTEAECIIEQHTYVHHPSNETIIGNEVVSGQEPPGFNRFIVVCNVDFVKDGKKGRASKPYAIPAADLLEAFAMLPGIYKKAATEIQAEVEQQMRPQIINPNGMPMPPGMIGGQRFNG